MLIISRGLVCDFHGAFRMVLNHVKNKLRKIQISDLPSTFALIFFYPVNVKCPQTQV